MAVAEKTDSSYGWKTHLELVGVELRECEPLRDRHAGDARLRRRLVEPVLDVDRYGRRAAITSNLSEQALLRTIC